MDQTTVTLHKNAIEDCEGPGICITVYSANLDAIPEPTNMASDAEVASFLPLGIKWEAKNNAFKGNKDGNICVMHVGNSNMEIMDTSL